MAKKDAKLEFFKFEKIGDSIEGKFNGYHTAQYGICAEIGSNLVGLQNANLQSTFGYNRHQINKGDTLQITYVEKKVTKAKFKVKVFQVLLNGNEIVSENSFHVASENELEKFFAKKEVDEE